MAQIRTVNVKLKSMATQPSLDTEVVSIGIPRQEYVALERAAEEKHTDVAGLVRDELVKLAERYKPRPPRSSPEEIAQIIRAVREEFQAANPDNRNVLEEFLAERRLEAARE